APARHPVAGPSTPTPAEPPNRRAARTAAFAAVVAHATTVPADHRYVALSDGQIGRILLVDLATGASTEVVTARGSPARPYYMPPFSESGDGKLLLVGAVGPAERSALYLVDVAAGRTALLY